MSLQNDFKSCSDMFWWNLKPLLSQATEDRLCTKIYYGLCDHSDLGKMCDSKPLFFWDRDK